MADFQNVGTFVAIAIASPCYACDGSGEDRSAIYGCSCGCGGDIAAERGLPHVPCYACDGSGEDRECDMCGLDAVHMSEHGQYCSLSCAQTDAEGGHRHGRDTW